jgi:hypothetical protein
MKRGSKKTGLNTRAMAERIAWNTGVPVPDVEKVLRELGHERVVTVEPRRAITWRTIVKLCLWMVGILFAFILLAVLIVGIAGR